MPIQKTIFILFNIFLWLIVLAIGYLYTWEFTPFSTRDGTFHYSMLWGNVLNAVVFYAHGLWLFPNRKRLKIPYWLLTFLLILSTAVIEGIGDYNLAYYLGLEEKIAQNFSPSQLMIVDSTIDSIFTHTGWYIFSFTLLFFTESARNERIQKELREEKLKAELKFLKAQINPHFLFNGINSVYFLIDEQPNMAKSTLLKFSDLLRYQLYECQDDFIPLAKELAHIESYIEMEKVRRGEDATILLRLPEEIGSEQISPLLFTPFLENAFKYLSNKDEGSENQVVVEFRLQDGQLAFEIENTIDTLPNKSQKEGGIGIKNVKKRLALMYPNKHQFDIFKRDGRFIVRMNLQLN